MARINIEDSLFKDGRFSELTIKLQSRTKALGSLAEAWIVAQEFWKLHHNGIPKPEWKKQRLCDALIECGMAADRGDFIYMCGSVAQFAWLTQAIEAGRKGGIASGNQRRITEAPGKPPSSGANPLTLTLTPSLPLPLLLSLTQKQEAETTKIAGAAKKRAAAPKGPDTKPTWLAFEEAIHAKYGIKPMRDAMTNSQMKKFVERVGVEDSPEVARFYVKHNKSWYVESRHSVKCLINDAEALYAQWQGGRAVMRTEANQVDRSQSNINAWDQAARILEGKKNG